MKIWQRTITDAGNQDEDYYFSERPRQMTSGEAGYVKYEGDMVEIGFSYHSRDTGVEVTLLGPGIVFISLANVSNWSIHPHEWEIREGS